MCHPCVPLPLLLRTTQVFKMPSHADIAANEAAESWGCAVRDRCGERHVCGPSFSIERYGSFWNLLYAGTDAEVLHATIRALPLTADQPGVLSDHLIALFHQAPNLQGLVLNLPVASSDTLLEALEACDRPKPGGRKVHWLREVEGQLTFARKATGASGYGQLACNIAPIISPHFDDTAPVRSLHAAQRLVWASEIHGMTNPERYTSVGGEVPLTFPAVAEPMIGTDDGRVVAHDLADLVAEQHTLVDEILSPEDDVPTRATSLMSTTRRLIPSIRPTTPGLTHLPGPPRHRPLRPPPRLLHLSLAAAARAIWVPAPCAASRSRAAAASAPAVMVRAHTTAGSAIG